MTTIHKVPRVSHNNAPRCIFFIKILTVANVTGPPSTVTVVNGPSRSTSIATWAGPTKPTITWAPTPPFIALPAAHPNRVTRRVTRNRHAYVYRIRLRLNRRRNVNRGGLRNHYRWRIYFLWRRRVRLRGWRVSLFGRRRVGGLLGRRVGGFFGWRRIGFGWRWVGLFGGWRIGLFRRWRIDFLGWWGIGFFGRRRISFFGWRRIGLFGRWRIGGLGRRGLGNFRVFDFNTFNNTTSFTANFISQLLRIATNHFDNHNVLFFIINLVSNLREFAKNFLDFLVAAITL